MEAWSTSAQEEVAAPPVWRSHVFASIFLEPYLDVAESCTGGSTGPLGDAFDFKRVQTAEKRYLVESEGRIVDQPNGCGFGHKRRGHGLLRSPQAFLLQGFMHPENAMSGLAVYI